MHEQLFLLCVVVHSPVGIFLKSRRPFLTGAICTADAMWRLFERERAVVRRQNQSGKLVHRSATLYIGTQRVLKQLDSLNYFALHVNTDVFGFDRSALGFVPDSDDESMTLLPWRLTVCLLC